MPNVEIINIRMNRGIEADEKLYNLIEQFEKGERTKIIKETLLKHLPRLIAKRKSSSSSIKSSTVNSSPQTERALAVSQASRDEISKQDATLNEDSTSTGVLPKNEENEEPLDDEQSPLKNLFY